MGTMDALDSTSEITQQWQNPSDIFSLLLLVGSDVVQQCITRLTGVSCRIPGTRKNIHVTPAAFSFGWVGFAFLMLGSVFGDGRLLPKAEPGVHVINCRNGYNRTNASWLLGRLLRDHEDGVNAADRSDSPPVHSSGRVSLMIDIFVAEKIRRGGNLTGSMWWCSWLVILAQNILAVVPWILYDDWSIFLITGCGTLLALLTASLPQWTAEKWSANTLRDTAKEAYAVTRGNGSRYATIILAEGGSWDIEALSSGRPVRHWETGPILLVTAVLWVLLLLTVTGLKDHAWFLIGVGGIGTIQNIIASALPGTIRETRLNLRPFTARPRITGYQMTYDEKKHRHRPDGPWTTYDAREAQNEFEEQLAEGDVRDVMGALMELEKYSECHGAGAALVPVFFPDSVSYSSSAFHSNREREYWKFASTARPG